MLVVGLTGPIGSGKTTFAVLLAERGAQVIEADLLGRDAVRPGRPAWHSVVDQFGEEILAPTTMEIDRRALAEIVFRDRTKLAALNAIVHPVIFRAIADELEKLRGTDEIVVLDAALIIETGLDEVIDVLVVVTAPQHVRERRLVNKRGLSLEDVRNRIASQQRPEDLVARADVLVSNDGSLEDLAAEAERVWKELQGRRA
ncbi:MAG TPA: dephospho-CoA kinase [Actinomycetota bacterium]|nr:dephospho-CoA kinase [Actinomycetota bacterium]